MWVHVRILVHCDCERRMAESLELLTFVETAVFTKRLAALGLEDSMPIDDANAGTETGVARQCGRDQEERLR